MAAVPVFTGVGVALVTLFHDDGALDAPATARLAAQLAEAGLRSIVVAGTTGEAAALNAEERIELFNAVRDAVPGEIPVIAGTGAPSNEQAAAFTRDAVTHGADAVLALSPPGAHDVRSYYDVVANAAGPTPVLAYHFPAVSPPGIPVDVLGELPIAGLKDSSGEPDRLLLERTAWGGPLYTGSSAVLLFAGAIGCAGAILSLANSEPERCIAAFNGDADAQLALVPAHQASRVQFPRGVKKLAAARFGTSTVTRVV